MRLIDADEAIRIWQDKDYIKTSSQLQRAVQMLKEIPTVDEWIPIKTRPTTMEIYKNRREQRHITEEMNALLCPLAGYLNDDTKSVVKRALYLLNNLPYEEDNDGRN